MHCPICNSLLASHWCGHNLGAYFIEYGNSPVIGCYTAIYTGGLNYVRGDEYLLILDGLIELDEQRIERLLSLK